MKIASVTFSPLKRQVGGAQVPSIAFKQWCDILGVECDVVGILDNKDIIPGDKVADEINLIIDGGNAAMLNVYDAIFFQTPPMYADINIDDITRPYVMMLHAEFDLEFYGEELVTQWLNNYLCKGLVQIDLDGNFFDHLHNNVLFWYPCTFPDELISGKITPRNGADLMYASRISDWKNPVLFNELSKDLFHKSYMFGPCSNKKTLAKVIESKCERTELKVWQFDITPTINNVGYFWEVSGNEKVDMAINRMNLTGFEALKNGYMLFVNPNAIPRVLKGLFIEVDPLNYNLDDVVGQLVSYKENKDFYWDRINDALINSYASYNNVKYNIIEILNTLGIEYEKDCIE